MTPATAFFYFCGLAVFGLIVSGLNMLRLTANMDRLMDRPGGVIAVHIIGGLCWGLGALGAVVSGIVWIVTTLKS